MRRVILGLWLAAALTPAMAQEPAPSADPAIDITSEIGDAPAGTYRLDMSQSVISFRLINFGLGELSGTFETADGTLTLAAAPNALASSLIVRTEANSAQMANARFRRIMLGPSFFDAAHHPTLTFEARDADPSGGTITGMMTIRGVTAPATLESVFNGMSVDEATGQPLLHYTARGIVDRTDWGMTGYRWIAGSEIELEFDARFVFEPSE